MNGYATAQQAYTESAVMTAAPEQLVLMLYDGAIRFLRQAAAGMRAGDRVVPRERLRRAEAIVDELNHSLDMSHGDIPERLRAIYIFCKRHMLHAGVHSDADAVDEVIRLLAELRESWAVLAQRGAAAQAASAAA